MATGETRTKTRRVAKRSSKKPIGMTKSSMFRYLRGERDISGDRIWEILGVIGFDSMSANSSMTLAGFRFGTFGYLHAH